MDLKSAYSKLGMKDPLLFSLEDGLVDGEGPRQTGATSHMLIEMLLDLKEAEATLSIRDRSRLSFICVCHSSDSGRDLRGQLEKYNKALGLNVSMTRVRFILRDIPEGRLRGETFYSWGIYADHYVKEQIEVGDRLVGPYMLARRIEWVQDGEFKVYDRDGNYLLSVDREGAFSIVDEASCPISLISGPNVAPVCIAAWKDRKFKSQMRLRRRFEF